MKYKVYSRKEFLEILKKNGYELSRMGGTHAIFVKAGCTHITVPKSLNPMICRRLIKENNLVEGD